MIFFRVHSQNQVNGNVTFDDKIEQSASEPNDSDNECKYFISLFYIFFKLKIYTK